MTDLTQIPVPNDGPIANKVLEIYERSFPPEEQVPMSELRRSAERDGGVFPCLDRPVPPRRRGRGRKRDRPDLLFRLPRPVLPGFPRGRRAHAQRRLRSRILTHFRERYGDVPQLLEIEPVVREAGNYQQRVRRLAFYERNGFTVTNMLTHEADQTYRVLARGGIVRPAAPRRRRSIR